MNKICSIVFLLVTFLANAEDRFYIEDFTINPGETKQIALILQNENIYSAIQADLKLPTGLTVEQEDGEYIFDLTDRKARNHTVSGNLLDNGDIRVLISSQTSKTFSGTNGPLVLFNVTADNSFSGNNTISITNIIAAESNASLHYLPNESCTVSTEGSQVVSASLKLNCEMARLQLNQTLQLSATNENADNITWTSDDSTVATVDSNGLVTAKKSGLVAIRATNSEGASTFCAIFSYLRGDINEDDKVDVVDVNQAINTMLGKN